MGWGGFSVSPSPHWSFLLWTALNFGLGLGGMGLGLGLENILILHSLPYNLFVSTSQTLSRRRRRVSSLSQTTKF